MAPKNKKSVLKFTESENIIKGGLKPKDDPDKIDKEEFEEAEETEEVGVEEDEEENEEAEEEAEEEDEAEAEAEAEEDNEVYDDECMYNLTNLSKKSKNKKNTMNIDIDFEDNFEDEAEENMNDKNNKYVKPNERRTKPYLFEFERVRLIGDRACQLSFGAKPMIKDIEVMNPRAIAKLELEKKVIPLIVLRELPNGMIEKWKVSELNFF